LQTIACLWYLQPKAEAMDPLSKIAVIVALVAAPSTLWTAITRYSEWAAKMRGSKAIQVVALVSVVVLIGLELVDRTGLFWPSPSQIAVRRNQLEGDIVEKARKLDALEAHVGVLERQHADERAKNQVVTGSTNQVTVTDPKDCPPGYLILSNSDLGHATKSNISAPEGARMCIVGTTIHDAPTNIEIRPLGR
jgi:hypothetical protein